MPTFQTELVAIATATNAELDRLLPLVPGPEGRVMEAMRYAALDGGKRLRPFLAVSSADLFDVPRPRALRAAAAVEMIHCYSLVHDDLPAMDDDDMRRGRPTVHKAYDEATAILAGDALQAAAFEILAHPDTHRDGAVRAEMVLRLAVRCSLEKRRRAFREHTPPSQRKKISACHFVRDAIDSAPAWTSEMRG